GSGALPRADGAGSACGSSVGVAIVNLRCSQDCPVKVDRSPFVGLRHAQWAFSAYCAGIGIILLLRLAMIQTEPVITRKTISTPKARARILFVLSGPLPRCRKNTRWTPICAKASTINPTGMPGGQSKLVCATTNDAIVARIASPNPTVYVR